MISAVSDSLIKAPHPDKERLEELSAFSRSVDVTFHDMRLLNLAFTHTSWANESFRHVDNNERLEFLGDSVLGMITASYLFRTVSLPEGELSKILASVVSEDSLSEVALKLNISKYLLLGHGEEQLGGRNKKAILADAMEAIIAAIYLDQGLEATEKYVLSWMEEQVKSFLEGRNDNKDYKSMLQIYLQKRKNKCPEYMVDHIEGPQHDQKFYVKVFLGNRCYGPAEGHNKKSAEQNVARLALRELGLIDEKA